MNKEERRREKGRGVEWCNWWRERKRKKKKKQWTDQGKVGSEGRGEGNGRNSDGRGRRGQGKRRRTKGEWEVVGKREEGLAEGGKEGERIGKKKRRKGIRDGRKLGSTRWHVSVLDHVAKNQKYPAFCLFGEKGEETRVQNAHVECSARSGMCNATHPHKRQQRSQHTIIQNFLHFHISQTDKSTSNWAGKRFCW